MPNGVICGGAVDGSNQLGAIVTCQAITTRPAGAGASARAMVTAGSTSDTVMARRRMDRFSITGPPVCQALGLHAMALRSRAVNASLAQAPRKVAGVASVALGRV